VSSVRRRIVQARESADDAYMALVLNNAQGELTPLEIGVHALGSGLNGSEYARRTNMPQRTMADRINAARVFQEVSECSLTIGWLHLSAIYPAPQLAVVGFWFM
jgi:hypothetical protein